MKCHLTHFCNSFRFTFCQRFSFLYFTFFFSSLLYLYFTYPFIFPLCIPNRIYQNPVILRAASKAFWTSCHVISKLLWFTCVAWWIVVVLGLGMQCCIMLDCQCSSVFHHLCNVIAILWVLQDLHWFLCHKICLVNISSSLSNSECNSKSFFIGYLLATFYVLYVNCPYALVCVAPVISIKILLLK